MRDKNPQLIYDIYVDYELKSEHYSGPLDKLLELIETKKLEVTLLSLAEVTGEFLNYLKKLETQTNNHFLIADFLTVASKLILIKSKILIPSLVLEEEEKEDIAELEKRLKIYAELKAAQIHIKENWNELPQMTSREFLADLGKVFYPPKNLNAEDLRKSFAKLIGEMEKLAKPKAVIKRQIVSLSSKIKEILKRVSDKPASFHALKSDKTKEELVILFLAILHLLKDQLIFAEQAGHFEDIKIAKNS